MPAIGLKIAEIQSKKTKTTTKGIRKASEAEKEYYGYEFQWLCFWIEFYDASKYWEQ
jgi:hypothetical protein